ncbi:uncharacterized protein LOC121037131 isoform X1 [Herpailurus yagouaroundi]|uniref:uncharacterized protein LOC121037131 isoform X1 n=1 Tax=Herpailurus yagouaroundi TaxID=1608482 RepID=UPI001AD7912E|nr:uncharacterized protein LOC121037131 isoform X1 [Puma yagouaroundi]
MRLSVRAPRRARPELFVNYISRAFIAPEPRATQKPPPPPQTASLAPGAPASRRSGCDGSAGPEVSGSPTRDLAPEKGGVSPAGEGRGRYAGQDRILRATLLLSLFQSLRNSGPQCYDKAARKGPATLTVFVEFRVFLLLLKSTPIDGLLPPWLNQDWPLGFYIPPWATVSSNNNNNNHDNKHQKPLPRTWLQAKSFIHSFITHNPMR